MTRTLPRRLFLRGAAGVAVGLPLLESIGTREASAQTSPHRFAVFLRQGNGVLQDKFWPSGTQVALTKARLEQDLATGDKTVGVLAAYAEKLNVVHGLRYRHSSSGCGHADGCFQALTASTPDGPNSNLTLAMGPSLDWVISQQLDPTGSEPVSMYAGAANSYLGDVILYRGPRERRAGERSSLNAYQRLFGSTMPGMTDPDAAEQNRLALQRKSVNDLVRDQMRQLLARPELSAPDKVRLDAHFSAIRDLEIKMAAGCQTAPPGQIDANNIDAVIQTHIDVIAMAMACGKSHAASLCIGNGNDQTQYTVDGVKLERYHHISHRVRSDGAEGAAIPDAEELHHKIDKKFAGYFKYLLDKLSSFTTPTGTLLDDGAAVWFNDLADGPPHGSTNLPWIVAGSAGGKLKTGQYLRGNFTINKLHNSIGAAVGVTNAAGEPLDDFGAADYEKGPIAAMMT
jgi:Protein of unknown function (DUF1552)